MDPFYENISAPQFHDFEGEAVDGDDSWFDHSHDDGPQQHKAIGSIAEVKGLADNYKPSFWAAQAGYDGDEAASDVSEFEIQECQQDLYEQMKGEARGEETAYSPHYSDYKKSRNDIERHTFASGNVQEEFDHEDHAQEQRFQQTFGLTVPESPVFHTHREEKELLRIERERKQLQNRLRSSRRRSERAVDGSFGRMPARSTKPLTEPKEFILRTSERSRPMQVQMEYDEEGRIILSPVPRHRPQGLTVPKDFSFATEDRAAIRNKAHPQRNKEEQLLDAQDAYRNTCERKRGRPAYMNHEMPNGHMETARASGPRKEKNEHYKPFKALPYNKRIMESGGDIGVPIVQKRKLTVPREPLFATDERMAMRQFDREEDDAGFRSESGLELEGRRSKKRKRHMEGGSVRGPMADFDLNFEDEQQTKRSRPLTLTVPQSPALATKERSSLRANSRPTADTAPQAHEKPQRSRLQRLRDNQKSAHSSHSHELTEPKPFNFSTTTRMSQRRNHLQQREADWYDQAEASRQDAIAAAEEREIQKERQQQQRHSHHPRKLTQPKPFNFRSEQRSTLREPVVVYEDDLPPQRPIKRRTKKHHHTDMPFFPARSTKPLTVIEEFQLNSDTRAQQRAQWENQNQAMLQQRLTCNDKEGHFKAMDQARREQDDLVQYRKSLVHKARPIMRGGGGGGHTHHPRALTIPQSPMLATRARAQTHHGDMGMGQLM